MTPERVYALLVEANPVPDPDAHLEAMQAERSPLHLVEPRRETMETLERIRPSRPEPPKRRPWLGAVAAAIVIALAVGIAAWLASSDEAPVVDEPAPTTVAELDPSADALAAAEAFFVALAAGDIDQVERVTTPGGELSPADRRMWEFNAVLHEAGYGDDIGACTADPSADGTVVAVACTATVRNPVFQALDMTELTAPFDYFPVGGELAWKPYEGADFSRANSATAGYLLAFHPSEYASACDPATYGFEGIVMDRGLALTAECGALIAPLLEDIAAWIEAGRPTEAQAPASAESLEAVARAAAEAFYEALAAGAIDEVEDIVTPAGSLAESERRMWEFNAALYEAGYGMFAGECTARTGQSGRRVRVECPVLVADPVLNAVGITELVSPFEYDTETGRLLWRPYEGGDFSEANRASADYLRTFRPDEYTSACDPAAYGFSGIVFDQGLALTGDCGELLAPLMEDIAAWVRAGSPAESTG